MCSKRVVAEHGVAPFCVPLPRWCVQEGKAPLPAKKELYAVGDWLTLYARSTVPWPYGDNAETQSIIPNNIHDATVTKQEHVGNRFSQAFAPLNPWVAEPEPSPSNSDTDQDVGNLKVHAAAKLHVPALPFQKMACPPGLWLPDSPPRSQSYSPEPEPSPVRDVFGMNAAGLRMSTSPELSADRLRAIVSEKPATKLSLPIWQPECEQAIQESTKDKVCDLQIQHARELASLGHGLSGYATVMIQQVPFKYTQSKLMNEINLDGFQGKYDFFYLPANARNHGNRGFGFINFVSARFAQEFYCHYHGQKFKHHEASLPVAVIPADVQGFEESAACFFSSWQLRKKKRHSVPVFLKPVPAHVQSQNGQGGARGGNMVKMLMV